MNKTPASALEIKAEIGRRIALCQALDGRCQHSGAPLPRFSSPKQNGEPNWTVDSLPDLAPGCFAAILKIIDQTRLEYELTPSESGIDRHAKVEAP